MICCRKGDGNCFTVAGVGPIAMPRTVPTSRIFPNASVQQKIACSGNIESTGTNYLWEDIVKGSCLCGAVTFEATGEVEGFAVCHCTQCRKQSGYS